MQDIATRKIEIDPATQPRAKIDMDIVQEYATALEEGDEFPPVEVVWDGARYWLWDGFHRVLAARTINLHEVRANVCRGTRRDAQWLAFSANKTHGLRRSNEDKRRAVELALEHPKGLEMSDNQVARHCGVSHTLVSKIREELSCNRCKIATRTVTRGGTTYRMNVSRIGAAGCTANRPPKPAPTPTGQGDAADAYVANARDAKDDAGQDTGLAAQVEPESGKAPAAAPSDLLVDLICGDFDRVAYSLEPGSVDVILTEPPRPRMYDDLYLYGVLAEHATRLLRPNGLALVLVSPAYLPQVLELMQPYLAYHWTSAYLAPGGRGFPFFPRRIDSFWMPVLWFVNGEYDGQLTIDVYKRAVNSEDEVRCGWGQSALGMSELVEKLTSEGDLILDPFCGSSRTGDASLSLGRRFIGIDVDEERIEETRQRLEGLVRRQECAG